MKCLLFVVINGVKYEKITHLLLLHGLTAKAGLQKSSSARRHLERCCDVTSAVPAQLQHQQGLIIFYYQV